MIMTIKKEKKVKKTLNDKALEIILKFNEFKQKNFQKLTEGMTPERREKIADYIDRKHHH